MSAPIAEKLFNIQTRYAETTAIGKGLIVIAGTASNQVKLPGAAEAAYNIGVTVTAAAAAGDPIDIVMLNSGSLVKMVVNAASPAIVKGDFISSHGTTGRGRQWTAANAKYGVGYALEAATADADIIIVAVCVIAPPAS